jgi:hypothetical protein
MSPGRQSKKLTDYQIDQLKHVQRRLYDEGKGSGSVPQLKLAMAAPFTWETLQRALRGEPIWIMNHAFITEWLIKHFGPEAPAAIDGKTAAAGEKNETTD